MISLLIWALCPIVNSVMDLVENENFHQSIFSKLNPKFWYKRESWNNTKQIFGYSIDAWHIAKTILIFLFAMSVIFAYYEGPVLVFHSKLLNCLLDLGIRGVLWNLLFYLFYHKFFKLKKK